MYPTYLQQQKGFSPHRTSDFYGRFSMVGAILGGLTFGHLFRSLRTAPRDGDGDLARRVIIPLWMFAPSLPLILAGGYF